MRILYLGDVVGRAARKKIISFLPDFKKRHKVDFTVLNGDNAAHGFGITEAMCRQFYDAGVDVLTTGNHVWDQRDEMLEWLDKDMRLLRPANYPEGTPGRGCGLYTLADGRKVGVMHLQGHVYMEAWGDVFRTARRWAEEIKLGKIAAAALIDIHGEATSEKNALGHYCDGLVSFVVGSHTHVPTADAQILPKGTAYQTDAGMCGCFNSVIGMDKKEPINRFLTGIKREKYVPAIDEPPTLCGALVETDDKTGLAVKINMIRTGGRLQESLPPL
jgi:hypothetical protein